MDRDLACGAIGAAVALAYLKASEDIPTSSLGDTVGAAGVPHLLGYCLLAVCLAFIVQRLIVLRSGKAVAAATGDSVFDDPVPAFASAAGTVIICALFVFLLEPLGYPLAIALLIFALCVYQRVPVSLRLVAIAAGGAFVLWLLFAMLLSVRMPAGLWAQLV